MGFRTFIGRYPDERLSVIFRSNLAEADAEGLGDAIASRYRVEPGPGDTSTREPRGIKRVEAR